MIHIVQTFHLLNFQPQITFKKYKSTEFPKNYYSKYFSAYREIFKIKKKNLLNKFFVVFKLVRIIVIKSENLATVIFRVTKLINSSFAKKDRRQG